MKDGPGGPGGAACVEAARAKAPRWWTCIGNSLTYEKTASDGRRTVVNEQVSEPNSTLSSESVSDSDDTNCEYTDICNVVVSAYCSWVKGNAAYGGGGDVWGNFDIVWRQCFDGPWPRWRLHLIWDSGYQVNPDFFYAQARKEINNFPDPVKGYEELYPAAIHAYNWHAWYPSSTGWSYSDRKITESGSFHDDLAGYFKANNTNFSAGTLHTGHWKSTWNSTTRIYDQKYTAPWY